MQQCPYCGEPVDVEADELGPSEESYVEDCSVCCRPWVVHVRREEQDGRIEVTVWLEREDD